MKRQITLGLDEADIERLDQEAKSQDRSRSGLARKVLLEYLDRCGRPKK